MKVFAYMARLYSDYLRFTYLGEDSEKDVLDINSTRGAENILFERATKLCQIAGSKANTLTTDEREAELLDLANGLLAKALTCSDIAEETVLKIKKVIQNIKNLNDVS